MGSTDVVRTTVSPVELQKQLQLISQARRKNASVNFGVMKGRLVVRVVPRWNLLLRAFYWMQSGKANKQYRSRMLDVLQDKASDLSLKKQVYEGIASGQLPCFSRVEAAQFRAKKAPFFRRASISGVADVTRLLSGGSLSKPLSGGAFFVKSEQEKLGLIEHYRQSGGKGEIALVRRPADFDKDDLSRTVSCTSGGVLDSSAGRLFCDEPITVVIDFTVMTPAQIASLNELFDTPPRYQGRTLGSGVALVGIITRDMQTNNPDNPGPDFWRRMDSLGVCPLPEDASADLMDDHKLLTSMEADEFVTAPETPQGHQAIDFYKTTGHWKTLIFGGFQLSDQGKLFFQDGTLAKLDRASGYVELVNAPMDDPEFVHTLAEAVRNRGFWANGQWVALPDDLHITTQVTSMKQINHELSDLAPVQSGHNFACINEENIEAVLAGISLKDGRLLKNDTLAELMTDAHGVVISSDLPESQWVLLINQLLKLQPRPALAITPDCHLPPALNLKPYVMELSSGDGVQAVAEDADLGRVFEYHIDARTQPQTLLCSMPMLSQQSMTFAEHYTPLMEAILAGKPVCLHGLESNPVIARQLESLLSPDPYLFVAGNRIPVPKLKLSCVLSGNHKLPGVWGQLTRSKEVSESQVVPAGFEAQLTPENLTHLQDLVKALRTIPRSGQRLYPDMPQMLDSVMLTKIAGQVIRETRTDGGGVTSPYHWRKALNDVLAKEYRGDRQVYGFVKSKINQLFADAGEPGRVNGSAVARWLSEQAEVSPEILRENYWRLARYVSPECLANPEGLTPVSDDALKALMPVVVLCAPPGQQLSLVEKLGCQMVPSTPVRRWDGDCYGRVYNALVAAGSEGRVQHNKPLRQQALELSGLLSDQQAGAGIPEVLASLERWFSPALLRNDFRDLPEALVSGKNNRYRQLRRVRRLAETVESIPLIMLKGEAGTGKTYTAYAVASSYANGKPPMVLSLSPEHTQDELFGKEVLKPKKVRIEKQQLALIPNQDTLWQALCSSENLPKNSGFVDICFDRKTRQRLSEQLPEEDFYALVEAFADHYTEFKPGPLLEWAEMKDPPVLILDEANLVKTGVLEPLVGLKKIPPVLSIHGRLIKLTPKHRVIMTGNPESYDGRLIDPKLRKESLTLYYRPMSESVLAEVILTPGMPGHWSDDCKPLATVHCMELYQQFRKVLPGHTFGPRDLKDILARLEGYAGSQEVTMAQINSMIWQAVSDCLASEVTPVQQPQLRALRHWFHAHHACDASSVEAKQQGFDHFYQELKRVNAGGKFDFDVPSVKELAFKVWLDLEKSGGKHAVIIEGEAGRGKDALLDRLLPLWQAGQGKPATFSRINASVENWEEIKQLATKAMQEGSVLVISELNTLPSRYLEGFFNEVLNGEAAKGFKLIATINPATYSGREAFSEAMQSRCTLVKINPFTEDELQGLLSRRHPGKQAFTRWLTSEHCRLEQKLKQASSAVKLPPVKLINAAEALKNVPVRERAAALAREYRLAMVALESGGKSQVSVEGGATIEREEVPEMLQKMQKNLDAIEKEDKAHEQELLESKKVKTEAISATDEAASPVPGSWALRLMPVNAIASLVSKLPLEKALSVLGKLPFHHLTKLASLIPINQLIQLLGRLPFDKLVKLVDYLPLETMVKAVGNLPLEKVLELMDYLSLEKIVHIINYLPMEKLVRLASKLPLERLAGLVKYLPMGRLVELVEFLPLERLVKACEQLDLDQFAKVADSLSTDHLKKVVEELPLQELAEKAKTLKTEKLEELMHSMPAGSQQIEAIAKQLMARGVSSEKLAGTRGSHRVEQSSAATKGAEDQQQASKVQGNAEQWKSSGKGFWSRLGSGWSGPSAADLMGDAVTLFLNVRSPEELLQNLLGRSWFKLNYLKGSEIEQVYRSIEQFPEHCLKQMCDEMPVSQLRSICSHIAPEISLRIISDLSDDRRSDLIGRAGSALLKKLEACIPESSFIELVASSGVYAMEKVINARDFSLSVKEQLRVLHRNRSLKPEGPEPQPQVVVPRRVKRGFHVVKGHENSVAGLYLQRSGSESELTEIFLGLAERDNALIGEFNLWSSEQVSLAFDEIGRTMLERDNDQDKAELQAFMTSFQEGVQSWKKQHSGKLPKSFPLACWRVLTGVRSLSQSGALSQSVYAEIMDVMLFGDPALPVEYGLEFLDDLVSHPVYGQKAKTSLKTYYRDKLGQRRDIGSAGSHFPHAASKDGTASRFKIDFLEKTLGKRVINQEWSQTPGSRAPNVDRLARKEAAVFPVNSSASELPAVVVTMTHSDLLQAIKDELWENPKLRLELSKRAENSAQKIEKEMIHYVDTEFAKALAKFVDRANWEVAVCQPMRRGDQTELPPGVYDGKALLPVLTGWYNPEGFDTREGYFDYQSHVDVQQISELQNDPNAIVLDRDKGREMVRDFIRQIPREVFYDLLFQSQMLTPRG